MSTKSLIGVISDTHDQIENICKAISYFNDMNVGLVIHCGDWVSPFTLSFYRDLKAQLFGIFGNNDGDKLRLVKYAQKFNVNVKLKDQFMVLKKYKKNIAVYHGEYPEITSALEKSGSYDVVLHGHTHKPKKTKLGDTISLNPGSLMEMTDQNIRFASIGLYDAKSHSGSIIYLRDI
jgi:hypothetical protein